MEWIQRRRRSDKEHDNRIRAAKAKAGPLPPRIPPDEKTLTVKMPSSAGSTEPRPLRGQPLSSDGNSSSEQLTPPSSTQASSDAQTPSPSKSPKNTDDAEELNETDVVDPLAALREHYIPDQNVPSAPTEATTVEDYDPRHIENMEADYEGQHSSRDERRSGEYGGPQSYHAVPSPPPAGLDAEEELAGPTAGADASPSTEARLLTASPQPESPRVESSRQPRPSTPVPPGGLSPNVEGGEEAIEDNVPTDI